MKSVDLKPAEQIYISVRTVSGSRTAKVAARSDGVFSCDAEELISWFSGDTAENIIQTRCPSCFFHPLPSGCFALGTILPETKPHKKNGEVRTPHTPLKGMFQVQVFLVPAEMLLLYGNNPLILEQKLFSKIIIKYADIIPSGKLESIIPPVIKLPDSIELFDEKTVKKLCKTLGTFKTAEVIQNISDNVSLILSQPETISPLEFLKALFSLLPLRFRTELSFSTETHISASHPFRLIFANESKRRIEEVSALSGISHKTITEQIIDKKNQRDTECSFDPYSQFIFQIIHSDSFGFMKRKLEEEYRIALAEQLDESGTAESNFTSEWDTLHIPAVQYLEEMKGEKTGSVRQQTGHAGIESIKPLLRSSASAEHILALLKQESKHLTDLLANIRKTK